MERIRSVSPEIEGRSKRKRDDDPEAKSAKKRRNRRTWRDADRELDTANNLNLSLARLDPQLTADLLAKQARRYHPDLSALELEEVRVPVSAITDTSDWTEKRLTEKFPTFLRHIHAKRAKATELAQAPPGRGAPHTLVVAPIALRAADLARVLRVFQSKKARVAKLFSKHIKLAEAIASTKRTRIGIGVGTPQRLSELLEAGALSADKLERVVVDFSRIDNKTRGVLDVKETQTPLMHLLGRKELREGYEAGRIEVVFY